MAQVQKEDIRRIILQAARGEFLQKGFKDTSMRTISRLSGVTLSNIYNYFRDKDEIFRAVLTPLLNAFEQLFAEHNSDDYINSGSCILGIVHLLRCGLEYIVQFIDSCIYRLYMRFSPGRLRAD